MIEAIVMAGLGVGLWAASFDLIGTRLEDPNPRPPGRPGFADGAHDLSALRGGHTAQSNSAEPELADRDHG